MVKIIGTNEFNDQCPTCGGFNFSVEVTHYEDGSVRVIESCICGHYKETYKKPSNQTDAGRY